MGTFIQISSLILVVWFSGPAYGVDDPPETGSCENLVSQDGDNRVIDMAAYRARFASKKRGVPEITATEPTPFRAQPLSEGTAPDAPTEEEQVNKELEGLFAEAEAELAGTENSGSVFAAIDLMVNNVYGADYLDRIELLRQDLNNTSVKFETLLAWIRTRQPAKIPEAYSPQFARQFVTAGFDFDAEPRAWLKALVRMKTFLPTLQSKLELDEDFNLENLLASHLYYSTRSFLSGGDILDFISWFMTQNNRELARDILSSALADNYALPKLAAVEGSLFKLIDDLASTGHLTAEQQPHWKLIFKNRLAAFN